MCFSEVIRVLTHYNWCPVPPIVEHSTTDWENSLIGDVVTYTCNYGYSFIDGSRTRVALCLHGGNWTAVPSKCEGELCIDTHCLTGLASLLTI